MSISHSFYLGHPLLHCGIFLFLFSIECFLVYHLLRHKTLWKWMGLFSGFLGLHEVAHLVEVLIRAPHVYYILCVIFLSGAMLCFTQVLCLALEARHQWTCRRLSFVFVFFIISHAWITGTWASADHVLTLVMVSSVMAWAVRGMSLFVKDDQDPWQRSLLRLTLFFFIFFVLTLALMPVGGILLPGLFDENDPLRRWDGILQVSRTLVVAGAVVTFWIYHARTLKQKMADDVRASLLFWEKIFLASLALVLLAGWYIIILVGQNAEIRQKNELLDIARVVAASVDPGRVLALKGAAEDVKDPGFFHLRQQQLAVGQAAKVRNDIRWFYQMVLRDGKIVFTADSILEDDPDYSLPGDVYADAPPGLYDVFKDGREIVVGPYQDRWGTFISAFVPIRLYDGRQIVGVQGVDVDLRTFLLRSFEIKVVFLCILMFIVMLMGSVFLWQIRTHEAEDRLKAAFDRLRATKEDLEKSNELRTQAEIQVRDMVEAMPNPVFFKDVNGVYRSCNQAFVDYLGIPREKIIGSTVFDVAPGDLAERYHQADLDVLAMGGRQQYDGQLAHANGMLREVTFFKSVLSYPDGSPRGIVGIILDITERKQIERELRENEARLTRTLVDLKKMNARLEKTQDQLLQSEKLAAIGVLAAGVAHEINNPLGFVQSNLSVLSKYVQTFLDVLVMHERLKDAVDIADKQRLREICAGIDAAGAKANISFLKKDVPDLIQETAYGADRIKKIVSGLQHFSYASHGQMVAVNVNDVFEGIMNMVVNEVRQKAVIIKEYGEVPSVKADAQQLGQVFINIIVNAAHAVGDDGRITLRTFARSEEVIAEISDNGRGISPQNVKKIFDPFFTTKDPGKGTGLGLSISYDIIKKHKGRIEVESEEGKGTTFRILLPVLKAE